MRLKVVILEVLGGERGEIEDIGRFFRVGSVGE
jgi:hypothetical protein